MHKDYQTQESTEERTTQLIQDSKEIMQYLKEDGITLEEVKDYKLYPIADNDTPQLSADRLEYTLSSGMVLVDVWNLEQIKKIYSNLMVLQNEDNIPELGFKDSKVAEEFIQLASKIWPIWISNPDKLTMQFLADIVKAMIENGYLTEDDLYQLSEREVIQHIREKSNERIRQAFETFEKVTEIKEGEQEVTDKYCISLQAKKRYVIPLVYTIEGTKRINETSLLAKRIIDEYLESKTATYAYLEFNI